MKIIIVDTNIVFSAILNANSRVGEILFQHGDQLKYPRQKFTIYIVLILLFSIFTIANAQEKKCPLVIKSSEMQQSNSSSLQFCYRNHTRKLSLQELNSLNGTGVTIFVDTLFSNVLDKKLNKKLLSIYLINLADTNINITLSDGLIPMIQEAKDENGNWKPIEYWLSSTCGNSYYTTTIIPQEQLHFPGRRYSKGSFNTRLRIKAKINEKLYYSNEYNGSIFLSKFNPWLKPDRRLSKRLKNEGKNPRKVRITFTGDGFLEE